MLFVLVLFGSVFAVISVLSPLYVPMFDIKYMFQYVICHSRVDLLTTATKLKIYLTGIHEHSVSNLLNCSILFINLTKYKLIALMVFDINFFGVF